MRIWRVLKRKAYVCQRYSIFYHSPLALFIFLHGRSSAAAATSSVHIHYYIIIIYMLKLCRYNIILNIYYIHRPVVFVVILVVVVVVVVVVVLLIIMCVPRLSRPLSLYLFLSLSLSPFRPTESFHHHLSETYSLVVSVSVWRARVLNSRRRT